MVLPNSLRTVEEDVIGYGKWTGKNDKRRSKGNRSKGYQWIMSKKGESHFKGIHPFLYSRKISLTFKID